MVQLINIDPQHERILLFLYPNYSYVQGTSTNYYSNFIMRRDITTPAERNRVYDQYDDCVIISSRLYDELWNADVLKSKALEFARVNFKSRKKTLNDLSSDDPQFFIDNLISFMFTGQYSFVEDEGIMELFQAYGSTKFEDLFIHKCEQFSTGKVVSSMLTFLSKITPEASSVFYKRKYQALGAKIKQNYGNAFDYHKKYGDNTMLSYLMFFQLMVR